MAKKLLIHSSVRGERLLRELGVLQAFERGDAKLLVGPVYRPRQDPEAELRLLFSRDEQGEVSVGYARREQDEWETVESEPYSLRSYGYYQRRLKRTGDFVRNEKPLAIL